MKRFFAKAGLVLGCSLIATNSYSNEPNKFVYLGVEGGVSIPVVNKFEHKASRIKIRLKNSSQYGGKVGYSFYPQMALELSGTHHPKYKLHYLIPAAEKTLKIPGKTDVTSDIYMLSIAYKFQTDGGVTPFVILGGGIAQMHVKAASSSTTGYYNSQTIAMVGGNTNLLPNQPVLIVHKTKTNCLAWQAGVGVSTALSENFSIDLSAKLQVANNIKINYHGYNKQTGNLDKGQIKQTVAIGVLGIGFTYKLPV